MNYAEYSQLVINLRQWDPKTEYISKDLTVKKNPNLNGCLSKLLAIFKSSPSKETARAIKKIYEIGKSFSQELVNDDKTRVGLQNISDCIAPFLANGNKVNGMKLRKSINKTSQKLSRLCTRCQLQNGSSKVTDLQSLVLFAKTVSLQSLDIYDAQNYLENIFHHLVNLKLHLQKKNPHHYASSNQLLALARILKKKFLPSHSQYTPEQRNLKNSYLKLQSLILKQIFVKKLKKQKKELAALCKHYKCRRKNSAIECFLNRCIKKNKKGKLFSLPLWYHFTKSDYVLPILASKKILYTHKGVHPGAFFSTHAESLTYGSAGFAFSRKINRLAYDWQKAPLPPLITLCDIPKSNPIYLGKGKSQFKPAINSLTSTATPRIWAGFKRELDFSKPKKYIDPLGNYSEISLSLFVHSGPLNSLFYQIKTRNTIQKILQKRKIYTMQLDDLNELKDLIHSALSVYLPKVCENAQVISLPLFYSNYPFLLKNHPGVLSLN